MNALFTAIYGKLSGSDLAGIIGTRLHLTSAPEGTVYPYAVYLMPTDMAEHTFTETLEDVTIQFSLFSEQSSGNQVGTMFTHLKTLYDDCTLTVSGATFLKMMRENASLIKEDHTTPSGLNQVWHYAVDYNVVIV